jgi:hypothetical protein
VVGLLLLLQDEGVEQADDVVALVGVQFLVV